jgi:hypothetical protein
MIAGRGLILAIFTVVFFCGGTVCALSEDAMERELGLANAAFNKGEGASSEGAKRYYGEAILHFERIIKEGGIKNAKLYYNIGNAYLLKGDVGRSIVNYRRSERLDGSNSDVKKNLAFARSRRIDAVEVKSGRRVLKTLFFWHYDFSIRTRFLISCLSFGGLMIIATSMLWFGRKGFFNVSVVILTGIVICFGLSVGVAHYSDLHQVNGVIVAVEVVARQGDGMNYPASFKDALHSGTEFEVIRQQSGWLNIELSDGSKGWVPETSCELI